MADQDNDEGEWTESGNRVRYYRFRNKLKEKAGGGARQDGYVDEAALKRAESTFKKASDQYPKLVESSVAALANACAQALAQPPDERGGEFKKINALAHDLKGQGGTFGYPLITTFADSLFQFTDAGARQTDNYCSDSNACFPRLTLSMMELAEAVQMKGLGSALCWSR